MESKAYHRELIRQSAGVEVVQVAAPLLVPLIENHGLKYIDPILADYLDPLNDAKVESIALGCTHYCLIKDRVRSVVSVPVISQDEVIPEKLADYLNRHPEIEVRLGRSGDRRYHVTDITTGSLSLAAELAQESIELERVVLR